MGHLVYAGENPVTTPRGFVITWSIYRPSLEPGSAYPCFSGIIWVLTRNSSLFKPRIVPSM